MWLCIFCFDEIDINVMSTKLLAMKYNINAMLSTSIIESCQSPYSDTVLYRNHLQHINGIQSFACILYAICYCAMQYYYYHEMNETNDS